MKPIQGEKHIKLINGTGTGLFILSVLYYTVIQNARFLYRIQDLDLFVFSRQYLTDSVDKIGGVSVYIGSFLTQFFYHPWLGSLIYLALLLLVSLLTSKAFNLTGRKLPLSFIPALALLLSMTELGYLIYILKLDGFVYVSILGVMYILGGMLLVRKMKTILSQTSGVFLYLLIGYPVCGAYALFGGLLIVLHFLKQALSTHTYRLSIPAIVGLVGLFLFPYVYYRLFFHETYLANLFFTNLPNFLTTGAERVLWVPYLVIAAFFLVAVLLNHQPKTSKHTSLFACIVPGTLFLAGLAMVIGLSFHDKNFTTELAMLNASENGEWNNVLRLAKKQQDEPTRLIVMHTNLALYKLGLAGDNLFKYRDGNKAMKSPREILPMRLAGTFFYYQYGKPNYCYRWCMEDMVEYGMNASVLRYFVLSCIMNGETNLARKYNRILASTLFYKSWAKKYQYYIDHPDKVATAPEFANIISLTAYDNILDGDDSMLELYLKNSFAYMGGGTPALVEASLLFNLDMKDIPRFWPRFFLYARTHNRIPVHYQEAALLYQHLEQKVSLDNLPLDRNVVTNFNLFLDYVQKYVQYPEDQIRPFFYNQFGDTFWFYYFFVKDHSTAGLKHTRS